ncbi:MAG: DsrE family protein [Myxococcaceae bacterium]
MNSLGDRVAIFLHAGEYDRVHQGLSIAAAASSSGRNVDVFFFWGALRRLADNQLETPDFKDEELNDRFERRGIPTANALLRSAAETGRLRTYACSGSLQALGLNPQDVAQRVDQVIGWTSILQITRGVVDRFYL